MQLCCSIWGLFGYIPPTLRNYVFINLQNLLPSVSSFIPLLRILKPNYSMGPTNQKEAEMHAALLKTYNQN